MSLFLIVWYILVYNSAQGNVVFRSPYGIKLCERLCQERKDCVNFTFVADLQCLIGVNHTEIEQSGNTQTVLKFESDVDKMRLKSVASPTTLTLSVAIKLCDSVRGRLVKIDSKQKQRKCVILVGTTDSRTQAIGVYSKNGRWYYIDDEPVSFTVWKQPNKPSVCTPANGWYAMLAVNVFGNHWRPGRAKAAICAVEL